MSDTVKMNEYEAKLFVEPQNKKKVDCESEDKNQRKQKALCSHAMETRKPQN